MGLLDEMMVSPEEKTRAQYEGLLSMGLGILANNTSKNAAPALGRGGMIGMNQYKESINDLRQQKMQDFMMKQKVGEYNRNQQRDAAIAQLREQIPEQMRPMFDMNPEWFIAQMNKPRSPIKLGAGETLVDEATYQPLAKGMPKDEATPAAIKEYQFAASQGFKGSFTDFEMAKRRAGASNTSVTYGSPVSGVDAKGNQVFFQPSKDGVTPPAIIPGISPPDKGKSAATEDERKAAGWVAQAENAWENLRKAGFNKDGQLITDARPNMVETISPFETFNNASRSPGRQKFVQASSSMSEALLRAATGAGVNKEEAAQKVRELTPQAFDSTAVIQQKMDAIPVYLKSLRQRAGRALPADLAEVPGVPQEDKKSSITNGWSATVVKE